MDQMVLNTQKWLNTTYGDKTGFGSVEENGHTGWDTIYGLIRALQIELGITATANNFGSGTQSRFVNRWPNGISQTDTESNVHGIIQGALWCKGYAAEYGGITKKYTDNMVESIAELKTDIGLSDRSSTIDLELMMALLSMKQFKLLSAYGGNINIRMAQQEINRKYKNYTGIIPTDGLYGREMNKALIQVLQAIEGFTPAEATGNFGNGTKSRLQTISGGSSEWVWLASVALLCNGYFTTLSPTWNSALSSAISSFQKDLALTGSVTLGIINPTTWMSLLTSKGDPDRACTACDTRFEITDERLKILKSDGYEIVGRYLTEPNQDSKDPENYFKAIRPSELERITKGGMKFFPIFQEYSTELRHFTAENGARHAKQAREAAQRLGIPGTYIYFAVDYDATDPEVTSNILPYFQGVRGNLGGGYKVGIYASRNICTRVINAGYAGSAFVSDMSTGFSGNLGFPIPEQWNYDQFTEISDYKGYGFDLDRVAYSGKTPAVDYVAGINAGGSSTVTSTDYKKLSAIDLVWHLEKRFEELRAEGKAGEDYVTGSHGAGTWVTVPTWRCILNYLAKSYLRDGSSKSVVNWAISAESFRSADAITLENDSEAGKIITALDRYIASDWRQSMTDITGESVDLAHLSATTLGYTNWNVIPDAWTGWAGDLATAMENIQKTMNWNPSANLDQVSAALVGQGNDYRQHPGLAGLVLDKQNDDGSWSSVGNNCNRDDLCCDGDAIVIASTLENGNESNTHLLSETLREYYNNPSKLGDRFKQIATSIGANNYSDASTMFKSVVSGVPGGILRRVLADSVSKEIRNKACEKLAAFIF